VVVIGSFTLLLNVSGANVMTMLRCFFVVFRIFWVVARELLGYCVFGVVASKSLRCFGWLLGSC